ncbi:MAG: hypothetical protein WC752_00960 [Patescibacteria group bacterium]|jgi:NADH:ubiquinone oxidoreductase subunit 3 (subunit A)
MDNFIFGMQGLARSLNISIGSILNQEMVWGFALGFCASTLIHMFIVAQNPLYVPSMIMKTAPDSFTKVAPRNKSGTYEMSYAQYSQEHSRVRLAFYLAIMVFLIVIAVALIRY